MLLAVPIVEPVSAGAPLKAPQRRSGNVARVTVDSRWKPSPVHALRVNELNRRRRFDAGCTADLLLSATTESDTGQAGTPPPSAATVLARQLPGDPGQSLSRGTVRNTDARAKGTVTAPGAYVVFSVGELAVTGIGDYRLDATRPLPGEPRLSVTAYPTLVVSSVFPDAGCARHRAAIVATIRGALRSLRIARA